MGSGIENNTGQGVYGMRRLLLDTIRDAYEIVDYQKRNGMVV